MLAQGSQNGAFRCEVEPHRASVSVRPVGDIDIATAPLVDAQLAELHAAGFERIVLDLEAVDFLDSTALQLLAKWDGLARADGFSFEIAAAPPRALRLFDLTGLTARLTFADPAALRG